MVKKKEEEEEKKERLKLQTLQKYTGCPSLSLSKKTHIKNKIK